METRVLTAADAAAWRAIRLRALREHPEAFLVSVEEEERRPERATWADPEDAILGAFDGAAIVGTVGFARERFAKTRHKAVIWGVYVAPEARGRGVGRRLLDGAVARISGWPAIEQVCLSVSASSAAARALYAAAGFVTWGVEPQAMLVDGRRNDEEHMVLRLR